MKEGKKMHVRGVRVRASKEKQMQSLEPYRVILTMGKAAN